MSDDTLVLVSINFYKLDANFLNYLATPIQEIAKFRKKMGICCKLVKISFWQWGLFFSSKWLLEFQVIVTNSFLYGNIIKSFDVVESGHIFEAVKFDAS